jgi:ABC-type multidrug transport system ATPase subunit
MSLEIRGVSKTYNDDLKALDGINLKIEKGIFGLLGPNGAGKSSLMRTIATLQDADEGEILFDGVDIFQDKNHLRENLGYLPQEFGVYPRSSALDLMNYLASLKGLPKGSQTRDLISDLLELVNLTDHKHRAVSSYSGGMKQRFGIAQALLGDPTLIIVDEPTAGLDPEERIRFLNIISEVGKDKIVILSTHIVEDVANLCQNFCIVKKGRVIVSTNPKEALKEIDGKIFVREFDESAFEGTVLTEKFVSGKKYQSAYCEKKPSESFTPVKETLEDYYLYQMKKGE